MQQVTSSVDALDTAGVELQRIDDDADDADDGPVDVSPSPPSSPKPANRAVVTAQVGATTGPAPPGNPDDAPATDGREPEEEKEKEAPMAAVVAPAVAACTFTRQELQALLKEAAYGECVPAYDAYFTRVCGDAVSPHTCRTCGKGIGVHPSQPPPLSTAPLVPFAAFAGPGADEATEYSLTGESTPSALAGKAAAARRGGGRKAATKAASRSRTGSIFFANNHNQHHSNDSARAAGSNRGHDANQRRESNSSRRQSMLLAAYAGDGDVDLRKRLLPPTVSLADVSAGVLSPRASPAEGRARPLVARPVHWDGGAHWFMPFLEFDGFGDIHDEAVVGTAHQQNGRVRTRAYTRWRCRCPAAGGKFPGAECGTVFVTKGVLLNARTGRPRADAVADFSLVWGANGDEPSLPIADHFREVHELEPATPQRWSTTLVSDACESPKTAVACLLCPCSVPSCFGGDWRGHGFCNVLNQVSPIQSLTQLGVPARNPSEPAGLGIPCVASHILATLCAPLLIAAGATVSVATVMTLCGFPCNSESLPPLLLFCCYKRRRNFVKALGADETPMQTRCYTVFCCPCSELQQFRELRNSGIWPGLMCCTASETDRTAMEPSAVRARYSVDGAYGVRARAGAGPLAAQTAQRFADFQAPNIGWRME